MPVHADVVQHLVAGERLERITVVIGPRPVLLGNPGALTNRGIDKTVRQGLRPGRLLEGVAAAPFEVVPGVGQALPLGVGQLVGVRPVPYRPRCVVEVDAREPFGVPQGELGRDGRSPVPALSAEPLVPEAGHEYRPRLGDPRRTPAGLGRLSAEPEPGQ